MARSGRSGGGSRPVRGGSRPTMPAAKPAPSPIQARSASTSAMPANQTAFGRPAASVPAKTGTQAGVPAVQQPQTGGGGGMLSNIVSTGMGVALGHQISNGISSMFGGSAEPPAAAAAPPAQDSFSSQSSWGQANCEADVKQFTKCMDDNKGNLDICGWYLSQLKACQQAAKEY